MGFENQLAGSWGRDTEATQTPVRLSASSTGMFCAPLSSRCIITSITFGLLSFLLLPACFIDFLSPLLRMCFPGVISKVNESPGEIQNEQVILLWHSKDS